MIFSEAPEREQATKALCAHLDSCDQCKDANEKEVEDLLCEEGTRLYEEENRIGLQTSASINLVKEEDGGWCAAFSDRPGGASGKTAPEALCNLADIVEECLNR